MAWLDITDRKRAELELVSAIELVMKDSTWFSRSLIEKLDTVRRRASPGRTPRLEDLTRRELDVFEMLCKGTPTRRSPKLWMSRPPLCAITWLLSIRSSIFTAAPD